VEGDRYDRPPALCFTLFSFRGFWKSEPRGCYFVSFGGTPITFTPDPRATSIASITS